MSKSLREHMLVTLAWPCQGLQSHGKMVVPSPGQAEEMSKDFPPGPSANVDSMYRKCPPQLFPSTPGIYSIKTPRTETAPTKIS